MAGPFWLGKGEGQMHNLEIKDKQLYFDGFRLEGVVDYRLEDSVKFNSQITLTVLIDSVKVTPPEVTNPLKSWSQHVANLVQQNTREIGVNPPVEEGITGRIDQTIITLCDYVQNKIKKEEIDLEGSLSPLVDSLAKLIQSRNSCR